MKTSKFISLILVIVFTTSAFGQFRPNVTGSGKVVSEDRKAGYFNAVKVSSGIDVYLTQGQKESIKVEADDNLHEYIVTEIKDNTLKVYSEANIRKAEAKKVYVTIKDVEKLSTSSAGDLFGETLIKSDELYLSASSAGDIYYQGNPKQVDAHSSSAGGIHKK
ncbi:MAG: DUF2807 domain-containing protein [Bacteroidetes bacterium]|nr:DUF2807 domain-containing protein [Bacteroidota bacterium]